MFRENRDAYGYALRAYRLESKQKFKGDLAYQGEDVITTPIKKPKNRELSTEQKELNKKFSGNRSGGVEFSQKASKYYSASFLANLV